MNDYSNNQLSLKQYGGSSSNVGILINDEEYIMKVHDHVSKRERNSPIDESYYRNNIFSEFICCNILKDIYKEEVQDVKIGKYFYKKDKKYREVILCKNFLTDNLNLTHFNDLINNDFIENSQYGREKSLSLEETLKQIDIIKSKYNYDLTEYFWKLIIYDMFFGNYDRHGENWGVITIKNKIIKPSPIYDCGSTLNGAIDTKILKNIMLKYDDYTFYEFLKEDGFTAFDKTKSKWKLTYYEILKFIYKFSKYKDVIKNVCNNFINKTNLENINKYINSLNIQSIKATDEDIQIRKEFIKRVLYIKLEYFIKPLLFRISNSVNKLDNKVMSEYKYNIKTSQITEISMKEDNHWNTRKDILTGGKYLKNGNTIYNIDKYENFKVIYAFDIKNISNAERLIRNYEK